MQVGEIAERLAPILIGGAQAALIVMAICMVLYVIASWIPPEG